MSVSQVASVAGYALSGVAQAIKALYQIAGEINEFIDDHIEKLKASDSPLVASTGRVLEAAKFGFGVGYMGSVAIIAVGQYLLGFTFAAVTTVATAATLTNPIAMTCGALGAIYYGWNALTDKERAQILERLSEGLSMGIELIRSLVEFVIRKSKDLMTSSQLDDVKEFVKTQAARFGRSLYDITGKVGDAVKGGVERVNELLGRAGDAVGDGARDAYESTTEGAGKVVTTIKKVVRRSANSTTRIHGFKTDIEIGPLAAADDSIDMPPSKTQAPPKLKR